MTDKTQEELQRLWDTVLIETWRCAGTILDAVQRFELEAGKKLMDCHLLRVPPLGIPWMISMRIFMAQRLEKIGDRLWDLPKEKDEALINKLQTSKYDTAGVNLKPDKDLAKEQKATRSNRAKMELEHKNYRNRNQKTDWKTVK